MRIILSFLIFCSLSFYGQSQDYNEQFQLANKDYEKEQYSGALAKYAAIEAAGLQSVELYYNIANSHYQQKNIGMAILYYERALQLAPSDADIQHNLMVTRLELKDDIEALPPFFLRAWWNKLRDSSSSTSWAIVGVALLWFGILGLILWQLGRTREQRKLGFSLGLTLSLFSILPFALAYSKLQVENHSGYGIILTKEVALRHAGEAESAKVVDIHAGTKVQLLDKIATWHKVRLANGEEGWLPADTFEEI